MDGKKRERGGERELHNYRLELVFEKKIPGLRVSEALRRREYVMRSRHFHSSIELNFLIEGTRFFFVDPESYCMRAGTAMLIDHDRIHKTSLAEGYPPDHRNFILQLEREPFDGLLRQFGYPGFDEFGRIYSGACGFSREEWALILGIIAQFKSACDQMMGEELCPFLFLQAMELLGIFAGARSRGISESYQGGRETGNGAREAGPDFASSADRLDSGVHQRVREIALYLQNHSAEKQELQEIAAHFYMSRSYLSRIFRKVTGFSVVEYLNFVRVRKAQELLKGSRMRITEISESTGFGNITYFERVFRSLSGQSPAQYRRGEVQK